MILRSITPKTVIVGVLLLVIILWGNKMREYSYAQVPLPGETADEYSFAWVGISLIDSGYPTGWSGTGGYKNHDYQRINVDGIYDNHPEKPLFAIDKPWFDHPPLFGLLTGGYAYLKGVRNFEDASVIIIRRPMLKVALITSILLFVLTAVLYSVYHGLFAVLLYNVIPTEIISSRLALSENLIIPLFLLALLLAHLATRSNKIFYWHLACMVVFLSLLVKLSALAIPISLSLIILSSGSANRYYYLKTLILSVFFGLSIFVLFGAVYDFGTFVSVIKANSARFFGAGSEIIYQTLTQPKITNLKYLTDGWIVLGWISFLLVALGLWKNKSDKVIFLAGISYFAIFMVFGSEPYGWYRFPLYPFFIISIVRLFEHFWHNGNIFVFFIATMLPIGTAVHRLIGVVDFQDYVTIFRIVTLIFFGLSVLQIVGKKKFTPILSKAAMLSILVFAVWVSVKLIYFYSVDRWYFVT